MRHREPFGDRFRFGNSRHRHLCFNHHGSGEDELDEHIDDAGDSASYSHRYDDHGDIPAWRQGLHVIGLILMVIGFLVFFSTFLSGMGLFSSSHNGFGPSSFSSFERQARSNFSRAVIGVLLIGAGAGLRTVAAAGLAGSGLILSPKRARQDLRPWAKMAGGLINDAANEVDAIRGLASARDRSAGQTSGGPVRPTSGQAASPTSGQAAGPTTGQGPAPISGPDATAIDSPAAQPTVVKVRCQKCRTLNDEDAKYCDNCGASL